MDFIYTWPCINPFYTKNNKAFLWSYVTDCITGPYIPYVYINQILISFNFKNVWRFMKSLGYRWLCMWHHKMFLRDTRKPPSLHSYTHTVQYMNNRLLYNSIMCIHMYCAVCNKQHTSIKFQTQPVLQYIFLPSLVALPDLAGMHNISCERRVWLCLSSKMCVKVV